MLYNIDIWLEIVGTIWNSAESSNFLLILVVHWSIYSYAVYAQNHVFVRKKRNSVSRFQRFMERAECLNLPQPAYNNLCWSQVGTDEARRHLYFHWSVNFYFYLGEALLAVHSPRRGFSHPQRLMLHMTQIRMFRRMRALQSSACVPLVTCSQSKKCIRFLPGYGPIAIADWSILVHCRLLFKLGF
jgi:hypothetical protein